MCGSEKDAAEERSDRHVEGWEEAEIHAVGERLD